MGIHMSEHDGICRVLLDGEVTIYSVGDLRPNLLSAILEHAETEVDLSAVDEMDSAGLQLMLMSKRCEGRIVRFTNHSAAVLRVLELANLGGQLGDPLFFSSSRSSG